jgi:hypothetical protein
MLRGKCIEGQVGRTIYANQTAGQLVSCRMSGTNTDKSTDRRCSSFSLYNTPFAGSESVQYGPRALLMVITWELCLLVLDI